VSASRIQTSLVSDAGKRRIEPAMKKALSLALEDDEIIELIRILMDDDADSALAFLKTHFKGKARDLLEGG
jgi:hypothetical protein